MNRTARVVLVLAAAAPLVMSRVVPVVRYGDASDYVMMAMSIARDGDLRYDDGDLQRILADRPPATDYPAGMFLVRDRVGGLHIGGHSFYYPLIATPFYMAFGFRGFALLNALLLGVSCFLVSRHFQRTGYWGSVVWAAAGILCSASATYTIWPTSEVWLLFLSLAFLSAYQSHRIAVAGSLLGLAAASQAPMGLWVVLPVADWIRGRLGLRDLVRLGVLALTLAAPQVIHYALVSGRAHIAWLDLRTSSRFLYYPVAFPGQAHFDRAAHAVAFSGFSRLEHFHPGDIVRALVSPRLGLLWFYPLSALAVLRMWRERQGGLAAGAALVVLAAFCTAGQLTSHQVGLRYLNPVYPALLVGFRSFRWDRVERALLVIGVLLGLSFLFFPRANSSELITHKAVPTTVLYR
ncbi:hypothetical protein JXA88_00355 [Candidatus Fermentibacteria bacterium]|nr:hypothetical protein [Candidatus Fermentibacteria bacterium]